MTVASSGAAEADQGKRPASTNLGSHPLTGDDSASADRNMIPDPQFWTVAEMASLMRVSKMTVYRMIRSGELESVQIGRSFRIPWNAVRKYAGRGTSGPGSPCSAKPPAQW